YVNAKPNSLTFSMGKDVGNRKVYGDICKMIHLLVAGSSGSGKSVFLGSLIISLITKYSPAELRLILIDPKKTEFVLYNDLPHLMINEIITDVNKAIQSLNWAIGEMNRRYTLFEKMSREGTYVVNIDEYNAHLPEGEEKLPKIVVVIDELADLMLAAKKEVEDRIQNLTQKARAAGIHLIVATQRPSADVITGVIKGNLPTRIAFAVASDVDSRVILDQTGAQKLLGKGDFLYTMSGVNTPVRVQSAFSSSEESQNVIRYIKMNNEAYFDESATAYINNAKVAGDDSSVAGEESVEEVYIEALRCVLMAGNASISMIQRKCSVGYNRAGKIVEWMEEMGYISAFDGAKARKVLITKEEFVSKYGPL
ncbi:MAG: DNA translocase FtsK, partial [Clostridia bacterium]|nr:DNA translocase FtsK [Clostridia bacterium]